MKKLERKKNEFYNEVVLDRFEESLKRDKSKDIIDVNLNHTKLSESLFIEINKKRIRVNKMF